MKFRILVQPDEDGVFVAECPTLPGCISQGVTRQEALTNIQDAIGGYLASQGRFGWRFVQNRSLASRTNSHSDEGSC